MIMNILTGIAYQYDKVSCKKSTKNCVDQKRKNYIRLFTVFWLKP